MTEQLDYSSIETQHDLHVANFPGTELPEGATVVPLSQLPDSVQPGMHRFICYFESKYASSDGKPVFGGLVVATPVYTDPQNRPNHADMCDQMNFRTQEGYARAWGGILKVEADQIKGVWPIGFSMRLQTPISTRDKDDDFKKAFEIAHQISEITGVCVISG